ncbi:MAG: hypothetical protein OHK93_002455 [Ramalina farinacea]|uniref:Uncharacterized protein n=1 Tax=Ramalina farinacea TaxID=258253 RepID=A0AA43QRK9_9LECA|nr:hypothetical protein [Ramalina farinacea]
MKIISEPVADHWYRSIQLLGDPMRPLLFSGAKYSLSGFTVSYTEVTGAVLPAWYFLGVVTSCLLDIFRYKPATTVPSGIYECAEHGVILSLAGKAVPLDYDFVWLILLILRNTFELYQMGNLKFTVAGPGPSLTTVGYLRFTGDQTGNMNSTIAQVGNISLPIGGQVGNVDLAK